jgi:diguanylate cyclase (GGDEF)-like protein
VLEAPSGYHQNRIALLLKTLRKLQSTIEDRMTLNQQVGVATIALCAVIVLVLASIAAFISERQSQSAAFLQLSDVAFTFSDRLDRTLTQRANTLKLIASLPTLHEVWRNDDTRAMRGILDQTKAYILGASWLGFAEPGGVVRAASGGLLEGQSVSERPWFKAGLTGTAFGDVHEAKLLAPLLEPSPDGQPLRFVDVATPVADADGKVLGVLGLHIGWNWVADVRKALVDAHTALSGLDISIVSQTGALLLKGDSNILVSDTMLKAMQQRPRGAFEVAGAEEDSLVGYARLESIQELGWYVVARQPASAALGAAHALASTILAIGALVAAIAFVGAIIISGRVSRPIRRLTENADRIGRDSTEMLPRVRGSLEVVQLSTALRSLVLRLGRAERQTVDAETRAADEARRLESDIAALRSIVDIDTLTGIPNRRGFMKFADDAMAQFRRYQRAFAVVMVDIDHFKNVNDTYGHAAGDAAIRQVAGIIARCIRPSDKCGRFGGEEFVVLLREVSPESVLETVERIREAVAAAPLAVNGATRMLTISLGVAIADGADRDIQDIVERADVALYAAKGAGRNRVVIAGSQRQDARLSA